MRHEQAFEEDAASAPTSSFIPTIAASILLAAFAVTGIYASHKASNVYGSAPSDLVSITGTTRTASPRNWRKTSKLRSRPCKSSGSG
ncbi:MAG: hypothetical protein RSD82_15080 [Comamonas sp.]